MDKKLFSEDFKNDLERMMGLNIKKISEDDLNKIKRIKLTYKKGDGTPKSYNLADLNYLKNLKLVVFDHFKFSNEDIEKIEKIPSLAYIHFDSCEFGTNHFNFKNSVAFVMFDMCKELDINMLNGIKAKSLKMVGSVLYPKSIDFSEFGDLDGLEELSINNFNIKNATNLLKIAPNINSLNFDGSFVEDYSQFKTSNITLSYRDKYLDGIID